MIDTSIAIALYKIIKSMEVNDVAGAAVIFNKILGEMPVRAAELNRVGCETFQNGQYAGLINGSRLIAQAVAIAPYHAQYQSNYAIALDAQGRHKHACRARAGKAFTDHVNYISLIEKANELMTMGCIEESKILSQKIMDTLPDLGIALNQLGCAMFADGKSEEAIELLRRSTEVSPDEYQFHSNLATALESINKVAEAMEIRSKLSRAPFFVLNVRVLSCLQVWGQMSGYIVHPIKQTVFSCPSNIDTLPSDIVFIAKKMVVDSQRPAFAVCATNMKMVSWRLPQTSEGAEVQVSISSNNDIVCDPQCLPFYSFIRNISDDNTTCLIDATAFVSDRITIEEDCFFLGGINNFGHWVADFLPNLRAYKEICTDDSLPIVVPKLAAWQRDLLVGLGINAPLIEMTPSSHCTIYEFKRVWLGGGFALPARYEFLRKTYHENFLPVATSNASSQQGQRIYISRAKWDNINRVNNEAEICEFLIGKGFVIVYSEQLNARQATEIFGRAQIVVSSPGSSMFNFFAFSSSNCKMICLWPETLFANGLGMESLLLWHVPYLDDITFVLGSSVSRGSGALIEDSYIYDVNVLSSSLQNIKNSL